MSTSGRVEKVAATLLGIAAANILLTEGINGLAKQTILFLKKLPLVPQLISIILESEVKGAKKLLTGVESDDTPSQEIIPIPEKGFSAEKISKLMKTLVGEESAGEDGRAFAYSYISERNMSDLSKSLAAAFENFSESTMSGLKDQEEIVKDVWKKYMHSNALNPMMYPSLQKFETEICSMVTWMLNGDEKCAGSLTSGGTESILMAVKTYRDMARKRRPHVTRPNMIAPTTIHPAFEKAAHYFDVEMIHIDLASDYRVDVNKVKAAINSNTILVIGSAPQYCHAVVDPIEELAELTKAWGIPLHVDACFGGFMLPWMEKLGAKIPLWDFRVDGVTSISADIHKYGYSSKGASVVVYKTSELRSYQYFAYSEWPGGLFGSPSMAGSRPGGMIAAAWAAMVSMGQQGYMDMAKNIMEATEKLKDGVDKIKGLKLIVPPDMTALSIVGDDGVNILAIADSMERRGWKMERQQLPDSLHMSILPQHVGKTDLLLKDLKESADEVIADPALARGGSTGVYGMVAMIPDKGIIDDFIISFFDKIYTTDSNKTLVDRVK